MGSLSKKDMILVQGFALVVLLDSEEMLLCILSINGVRQILETSIDSLVDNFIDSRVTRGQHQ